MPTARISGERIHYHLTKGCVVVRPEGACDEKITEALVKLVSSPLLGYKNLVLDLSHAKYVETPGFRWIVRQLRHLEADGKTLIVSGMHPSVERAFKLLQLDRVIQSTLSVPEAITMLRMPKELAVA